METKKQNHKQAQIQPKINLAVVSLSNNEMSQVTGGGASLN